MERIPTPPTKSPKEIAARISEIDAAINALDNRISKVSGDDGTGSNEPIEEAAETTAEVNAIAQIYAERSALITELTALQEQLQQQ